MSKYKLIINGNQPTNQAINQLLKRYEKQKWLKTSISGRKPGNSPTDKLYLQLILKQGTFQIRSKNVATNLTFLV